MGFLRKLFGCENDSGKKCQFCGGRILESGSRPTCTNCGLSFEWDDRCGYYSVGPHGGSGGWERDHSTGFYKKKE